MTDKGLTPEQDEAVRRLLGEARHDEPMPPAVTTRLDDVLAGLVAERAAAGPVEPARRTVVPLRSRRWPKVLVAAAAVSALGLGLGQLDLGSSTDDGADAGSVAEAEPDSTARDGLLGSPEDRVPGPAAPTEQVGPDPTTDGGVRGEASSKAAWRLNRYTNLDGVTITALAELSFRLQNSGNSSLQPLDRQSLSRSLRKLAASAAGPDRVSQDLSDLGFAPRSNARGATYDAPLAPRACGPLYTVVGGTATYARYRQQLSLVLFHPKINGAQLVEVYICTSRTPRRSVERVTLWDGE